MMRWLRFFLGWLGVAYLLSVVGRQASVNHDSHAGWNNSSITSVVAPPLASLQASAASLHHRIASLELFVTPSGLATPQQDAPPWLEYRGPPIRHRGLLSGNVYPAAAGRQRNHRTGPTSAEQNCSG
jgi:hypothetical protein